MRTAAFSIVYQSNFANHEVKYGALITEFRLSHDLDKALLEPILTDPSIKSPYCHVACAFHGEQNEVANDLDEVVWSEKNMTLSEEKRSAIRSFLNNVSLN